MRILNTVAVAFLLVWTCSGTFQAIGQSQKVVASDGAVNRGFGRAVAIDGTTAVVGAQFNDTGSAYVFTLQNGVWVEQQKLMVRDDPNGGLERFGQSVALSGDRIIVGAPFTGAFIFVRENGVWGELQQLARPAGSPASFGRSVAIDGTTAMVGATEDEEPGSAYVFTQDGGLTGAWSLRQRLSPSDSHPTDSFGWSVALNGGRAIVGAPNHGELSEGAAYVFVRQGDDWVEQSKLAASDAAPAHQFGVSVDIDGFRAIVGTEGAGSAYVFRLVGVIHVGFTWVQEAELTEPLSANANNFDFGMDVALSGNTAVVGAPYSDGHPSPAHVFRLGPLGWFHAAELTASDQYYEDAFGYSADVSNDRVIVGSPLDQNQRGLNAGSAYFYDLRIRRPRLTIYLYPKPNPAKIGDPFSWIMDVRTAGDPLKTTLGVFAFTADGRSQLLNRMTAAFPPDPIFSPDPVHETLSVFFTPAFPRGLPPALGFLLVMFDTATGEQIAVSADAIGVDRAVDPALALLLKQRAAVFARSLTLGALNALRMGRLENLQDGQPLPGLRSAQ